VAVAFAALLAGLRGRTPRTSQFATTVPVAILHARLPSFLAGADYIMPFKREQHGRSRLVAQGFHRYRSGCGPGLFQNRMAQEPFLGRRSRQEHRLQILSLEARYSRTRNDYPGRAGTTKRSHARFQYVRNRGCGKRIGESARPGSRCNAKTSGIKNPIGIWADPISGMPGRVFAHLFPRLPLRSDCL
jgi:hypothetical protein